jgi:hypothetical protein
MAYWHMDRARYYASVGDDARALRHMFGAATHHQRADMRAYENRLHEEGAAIDARERKDMACPELTKEKRECTTELEDTRARYNKEAEEHAKSQVQVRKLMTEKQKLAKQTLDLHRSSTCEPLMRRIAELEASAARAAAAQAEAARKSREIPASGGCSVM